MAIFHCLNSINFILARAMSPVVSINSIKIALKRYETPTSLFRATHRRMVYEFYFPEEIKAAGKEIIMHLGVLKPINEDMSDEEKLAVIQNEFDRLYDPKHPVRNHLEILDSVDVVRTIREALR